MPRLMIRPAGRALALLAGVAMVLSAVAILPSPQELLLFVFLAAIFTAPGWPMASWFAGSDTDWLTRTILVVPFGYFAGATTCCVLRLLGVSSPAIVFVICAALALLLAWALRRPQEGIVSLGRLGPDDHLALALLWLLAIAIVGPVFARVGQSTPAGLAYRAYFNADLFVHMSVVAELAKGSTPPANPFYPVEALPYYWTYFSLPGLFSQLRPALLVDRGIMLTDLCTAVTFISVGFLVVRNIGASAFASAVSWVTIVLASSFEGAYYLWQQSARGRPLGQFRVTNIDAVTRWFWNLPGVDGFHRAMWWTPQHLMALTLALIVLLTTVRAKRPNTLRPALLEGLMLGGMVIVSSFNGVLLVAWYALLHVASLLVDRGRGLGQWALSRSVAAIVVLGFVGLAVGLGMVQSTPNAFVFGWNRYFLRGPWAFILLSFGPALFAAPFGIAAALRASRRLLIALAALVVVSAVAFLFVDLRGHENTQVTFRTGQLLYICLAVLLAFAIDTARSWTKQWSANFLTVLLVAGVAAVPTVAMDWHNARDISNVAMSPGNFPWTLHISPDDQAAIQWIQGFVAPEATVQTDAEPRERNTWAFVPAFARRRMGTGNGIFTLNPNRYSKNLREIHLAFSKSTGESAHEYFLRIGVDYIYIGDVERAVDAEGLQKFARHPERFQSVYKHGSVEIFRIQK